MIKKELSIILQQECRGVGISEMVSVTVVRMSPDMSYARVFVSVFPSENAKSVLDILRSKASFFRGKLGQKVGKQLRIVPEFNFFIDDSLDYAERIDQLLSE